MSQQVADKKIHMSEDQVKQTIANLVAPIARPMRSPILRWPEVDTELRKATSFSMDEMAVTEYANGVNVPTFIIQVRDDILTKPSDVQTIFDNIPVKDKKLFWIEGTTRRFDGYNYLPEHPEQMIEWFDSHMGVRSAKAA